MAIPTPYPTDDLNLLTAYCRSPQASSFVPHDITSNVHALNELMTSCNLDSIRASIEDDAILVWSPNVLHKLSQEGVDETVSRIYLIICDNGLSMEMAADVQLLVDMHKVQVSIKRITCTLVTTDGQYNYHRFLSSNKIDVWHLMIASDNHDLYHEHLVDSRSLPNSHLVFPKSFPAKTGLDINIRMQMTEDGRRYNKFLSEYSAYKSNCGVTGEIPSEYDRNHFPSCVRIYE